MAETTIKIGDYDLSLKFDMPAWQELEEQICTIDELGDQLTGRKRISAIAKTALILAHRDDITPDELLQAMRPYQLRKVTAAIWAAIEQGMKMETAEEDEAEEVDVVLAELQKKDEKDA